jgi:hypothetical protein
MSESSRLNLNMLRDRDVLRSCAEWTTAPDRLGVSRRTFLSLGGVGIVYGTIPRFLQGEPFSIARNNRKLHFLVGDETLWTVDPEAFDGVAQLDLARKDGELHVTLRDALFPGTLLPASCDSNIKKTKTRRTLALTMDSGVQINADFLPWLLGREPAKGEWKGDAIVPIDGFALQFDGPMNACVKPDWSLEMYGAASAVIRGIKARFASNECRLTLNVGEPLSGTEPGKRSTFTIGRHQDMPWNIDLSRSSEAGWRLTHETDLFDVLKIEGSRSSHGPFLTALVVGAGESTPVLQMHPGGGLIADSGGPFHVDLENPRLEFSFEDATPRSSLNADLPTKPVWAHTSEISLLMSGGVANPHFEMQESGQDCCPPKIVPEVVGASFATDDDVRMQLKFADKRPLQFNWATVIQPIEDLLGGLHLLPWEHHLKFDLTCGDELHVLRSRDLLSLTFVFQNMSLHGCGSAVVGRHRHTSTNPPSTPPRVGDSTCQAASAIADAF